MNCALIQLISKQLLQLVSNIVWFIVHCVCSQLHSCVGQHLSRFDVGVDDAQQAPLHQPTVKGIMELFSAMVFHMYGQKGLTFESAVMDLQMEKQEVKAMRIPYYSKQWNYSEAQGWHPKPNARFPIPSLQHLFRHHNVDALVLPPVEDDYDALMD